MTPDTDVYYYAAYIAAGALYTGYAISLWWRGRRLKK